MAGQGLGMNDSISRRTPASESKKGTRAKMRGLKLVED
jgi:hypothetical protein